MPPDIGHRQGNEFSEGAGTIHANTLGVGAEMPSSRKAIPATPADHVALAAHNVARIEIAYVRPDGDNLTHEFMPNGHGDRNRLLRPIVPLENMHIGPANAGVSHSYQYIVDADSWLCDFFQPKPRLLFALD
jgi:hypothetical protein